MLIKTFHLNPGGITILHSESIVVNDKCDQHLGSVTPVVTGLTPPTKTARARYIWTDINSHQVVGTAQALDKVGAGTYSVKVIDVFFCTAIDTFTVFNVAPALIPQIRVLPSQSIWYDQHYYHKCKHCYFNNF